jgi:hypothetical protein
MYSDKQDSELIKARIVKGKPVFFREVNSSKYVGNVYDRLYLELYRDIRSCIFDEGEVLNILFSGEFIQRGRKGFVYEILDGNSNLDEEI